MSKKYKRDEGDLFIEPFGSLGLIGDSAELRAIEAQRVECLGITFENDTARREYFLEKLREHLKDPEFRKIEGFPIGEDEDILSLSDPPYYTACPNPFLGDFIKYYGKPYDPSVPYSKEPFAADVSEGKNDPIYNAHSYHTKVPHRAIMRYILHYTEPDDVVFDGFCGTGMTGVAAQICGDRATVESLGYKVRPDDTILDEEGRPFSELGVRRAILNDLSPAASFIAYNYNVSVDAQAFERKAKRILDEVENECGWMFITLHNPTKMQIEKAVTLLQRMPPERLRQELSVNSIPSGRINYTVWSDVFNCSNCAGEIIFWKEAVKVEGWQVKESFNCPHCKIQVTKKSLDRVYQTKADNELGSSVRQIKSVPVLIHYKLGKKYFLKKPDEFDLQVIYKVENSVIPHRVPTTRMPEGDESRRNDPLGITHLHHFYTKRNLWSLASYAARQESSRNYINVTSVGSIITKMYRFRSQNGSLGAGGGPLTGTLYVPSLSKEIPMTKALEEHIEKTARLKNLLHNFIQSFLGTGSSTTAKYIPDESIDYIFTDPPFGGNFMYSELNFIWESWLGVFTNNKSEAIESKTQKKGLFEYENLMTESFREYYRVLKSGRWMTVEFHNSKNSVWNAIQLALQKAGFVIADVRTLDKKQGTFKQVNSNSAVKQDLIISAYKPNGGLEDRFKLEAGTEEGVWDFVRTHLKQLPRFDAKGGQAVVIAERQNYLLFDRMVAFHFQHDVTVPLSAPEFYAGLQQRFAERDGMFFLPEQVAKYDRKRMTVKELGQLEMIPRDEDSAIKWIRQQLHSKPQTFQELQPNFMKSVAGWAKHEKALELSEMLEQNFLRYDGQGDVPSQIHSYLSTNFKELRKLPKDSLALRAKAKDRWYVPDPNKAGDIEKLRERALLKEFTEYRDAGQKKLKIFRLEAVRVGFRKAWQDRDYATIIAVANKIPEEVLQEDPKLLMWYDQALTRTGEAL